MATPESPREDIFNPCGQLSPARLSESASIVMREAIRLARETHWDSLRSPHIFMGLLSVPDHCVKTWGQRLGADLDLLLTQFQELFHQEDGQREALLILNREFLSDNVIRLLREAFARAQDHHRDAITPIDLLITLLISSNSIVAECFERIGVTAAKLTELAVLAEQQNGRV